MYNSAPAVECGGQVLLHEGVDAVAVSVSVIDFGQDVAVIKCRLSEPAIITGAGVSWELLG